MSIREIARRREVQVLVGFGLLLGVSYYLFLANKKKQSEGK